MKKSRKIETMKDLAIIFCRISDRKQKDGYSLEAQKKHATEYCREKSLEVIGEPVAIVETGSAHEKRGDFGKMIARIEDLLAGDSNIHVHLVVEKSDRLSRNFTSKEKIEGFMASGRFSVHYYKEGLVLGKNCSPELLFRDDMMTCVGKYHSRNLARESMKGLLEKAQQGIFPGRAPLGYRNERYGGDDKSGRKVASIGVDEESKAAVKRMFELRAVRGLSLAEIKRVVLEEGLLPAKRARNLHKSTVEQVIKNPFYMGDFLYKGVRYKGTHEVFVPRAWVAKAQRQITYGAKVSPSGIFSNFLICADLECGCSILYDPKDKNIKSTGERVRYHYYHCSDGRRVHRRAAVRQANVTESSLWNQFSEAVDSIAINEKLADAISETLRRTHEKAADAHKRAMAGYRQVIQTSEQEEDKVRELLLDGTFDKDAYRKAVEKIRIERRRYESLLEQGQLAITNAFYETSEKCLELAKNAKSLWNSASPRERLEFIKDILSNQRLDGLTVRYEMKKPFQILAQIKEKTDFKEWCPGLDSNQHASLRHPLKMVCLPISPPGQVLTKNEGRRGSGGCQEPQTLSFKGFRRFFWRPWGGARLLNL